MKDNQKVREKFEQDINKEMKASLKNIPILAGDVDAINQHGYRLLPSSGQEYSKHGFYLGVNIADLLTYTSNFGNTTEYTCDMQNNPDAHKGDQSYYYNIIAKLNDKNTTADHLDASQTYVHYSKLAKLRAIGSSVIKEFSRKQGRGSPDTLYLQDYSTILKDYKSFDALKSNFDIFSPYSSMFSFRSWMESQGSSLSEVTALNFYSHFYTYVHLSFKPQLSLLKFNVSSDFHKDSITNTSYEMVTFFTLLLQNYGLVRYFNNLSPAGGKGYNYIEDSLVLGQTVANIMQLSSYSLFRIDPSVRAFVGKFEGILDPHFRPLLKDEVLDTKFTNYLLKGNNVLITEGSVTTLLGFASNLDNTGVSYNKQTKQYHYDYVSTSTHKMNGDYYKEYYQDRFGDTSLPLTNDSISQFRSAGYNICIPYKQIADYDQGFNNTTLGFSVNLDSHKASAKRRGRTLAYLTRAIVLEQELQLFLSEIWTKILTLRQTSNFELIHERNYLVSRVSKHIQQLTLHMTPTTNAGMLDILFAYQLTTLIEFRTHFSYLDNPNELGVFSVRFNNILRNKYSKNIKFASLKDYSQFVSLVLFGFDFYAEFNDLYFYPSELAQSVVETPDVMLFSSKSKKLVNSANIYTNFINLLDNSIDMLGKKREYFNGIYVKRFELFFSVIANSLGVNLQDWYASNMTEFKSIIIASMVCDKGETLDSNTSCLEEDNFSDGLCNTKDYKHTVEELQEFLDLCNAYVYRGFSGFDKNPLNSNFFTSADYPLLKEGSNVGYSITIRRFGDWQNLFEESPLFDISGMYDKLIAKEAPFYELLRDAFVKFLSPTAGTLDPFDLPQSVLTFSIQTYKTCGNGWINGAVCGISSILGRIPLIGSMLVSLWKGTVTVVTIIIKFTTELVQTILKWASEITKFLLKIADCTFEIVVNAVKEVSKIIESFWDLIDCGFKTGYTRSCEAKDKNLDQGEYITWCNKERFPAEFKTFELPLYNNSNNLYFSATSQLPYSSLDFAPTMYNFVDNLNSKGEGSEKVGHFVNTWISANKEDTTFSTYNVKTFARIGYYLFKGEHNIYNECSSFAKNGTVSVNLLLGDKLLSYTFIDLAVFVSPNKRFNTKIFRPEETYEYLDSLYVDTFRKDTHSTDIKLRLKAYVAYNTLKLLTKFNLIPLFIEAQQFYKQSLDASQKSGFFLGGIVKVPFDKELKELTWNEGISMRLSAEVFSQLYSISPKLPHYFKLIGYSQFESVDEDGDSINDYFTINKTDKVSSASLSKNTSRRGANPAKNGEVLSSLAFKYKGNEVFRLKTDGNVKELIFALPLDYALFAGNDVLGELFTYKVEMLFNNNVLKTWIKDNCGKPGCFEAIFKDYTDINAFEFAGMYLDIVGSHPLELIIIAVSFALGLPTASFSAILLLVRSGLEMAAKLDPANAVLYGHMSTALTIYMTVTGVSDFNDATLLSKASSALNIVNFVASTWTKEQVTQVNKDIRRMREEKFLFDSKVPSLKDYEAMLEFNTIGVYDFNLAELGYNSRVINPDKRYKIQTRHPTDALFEEVGLK